MPMHSQEHSSNWFLGENNIITLDLFGHLQANWVGCVGGRGGVKFRSSKVLVMEKLESS